MAETFDPDAYLASSPSVESSFNPDEYLASTEKPKLGVVDKYVSPAVAGGLQGPLWGARDYVAGAGMTAIDLPSVIKSGLDSGKTYSEILDDLSKQYGKNYEFSKETFSGMEKNNPAVSGLAEAGSSFAALGGAAAKGGKLVRAAKGALQGGTYSALRSEGDVETTLAGAGAGAGAGVASKLFDATALRKYAGEKVSKIFGQISPESEKALDKIPSDVSDVGQFLLDRGKVATKSTAKTIYYEASALKNEIGKQLGNFAKATSNKEFFPQTPDINGNALYNEIMGTDWMQRLSSNDFPKGKAAYAKVKEVLDRFNDRPKISVEEAIKLKTDLYNELPKNIFTADEATVVASKELKKVSGILNDKIKGTLEKVDPALKLQYEHLNDQFQKVSIAKKEAEAAGFGRSNKPIMNEQDVAYGATFGPQYSALKAAGKVVSNNVQYVRNTQALLAHELAGSIESFSPHFQDILNTAMKRGNQSVIAVDKRLSQDPEYKKERDAAIGDFNPDQYLGE